MTLGRAGGDVDLGGSLRGYRAAPEAGHGPGVLVMHGAWGLDAHVRDVCDRLAREGFVALAPDLFRGRVSNELAEARRQRERFEFEGAAGDVDCAVTALLGDERLDGSRLGTLGFCMGGSLALYAAGRSPQVGAAVDFYGGLDGVPLAVEDLRASVLGVFGDGEEASRERDALETVLRGAGKRLVVKVLPGVSHAFMNDTRPDRFDARAAAEGWDLLLAFLRSELR